MNENPEPLGVFEWIVLLLVAFSILACVVFNGWMG